MSAPTLPRRAVEVVMQAKAAGRWSPDDHPRDRLGRFIEVGAFVRIWGGGSGIVERNDGGGYIIVNDGQGRHLRVRRNYLTVVRRPDGGEPVSTPEDKPAPAPPTAKPPEAPEPVPVEPQAVPPAEPDLTHYGAVDDVPDLPVAPGAPPPDAADAHDDATQAANGHTDPAEPEDGEVYEPSNIFDMNAARLAEAINRIEIANRRAERSGIAERIGYTVEHYEAERNQPGDEIGWLPKIIESRVKLTLDVPAVRHEGYTFIGTMSWDPEAGLVTRIAPGQTLAKRPDARECDICHAARDRKDTYVVRKDDTGQEVQVGSNCLVQFLGIRPSGLWMLTYDGNLADLTGDDDEERGGGGGRGDYRYPSLAVLAATVAVVHQNGWMSRGKARDWGKTATADTVNDVISGYHPTGRGQEDYAAFLDTMRREVHSGQHDEEAAALRDFARTLDDPSEYATNLRAVAGADSVDPRNLPLLASAIAAKMARDEKVERERVVREATADSTHIGTVGDKIADHEARITAVRSIDGDYGTSTLLTMVDGDGNVLKWFASGHHDEWQIGDEVAVSGTIKDHGEFRGVAETTLTRCKITPRGATADRHAVEAELATGRPDGFREARRVYTPERGMRVLAETFPPGQQVRVSADDIQGKDMPTGYHTLTVTQGPDGDQYEARTADGSLVEFSAERVAGVYDPADPFAHPPSKAETQPAPGKWERTGGYVLASLGDDGLPKIREGQWVRVWVQDRYVNALVVAVHLQSDGKYVTGWDVRLPDGTVQHASTRDIAATLPMGTDPPKPRKPKGTKALLTGGRDVLTVEVKDATPDWKAEDHPRDRHGRFIEVGSVVSLFGGGQGTVTGMLGDGRVEVRRDDGKTVPVNRGYLTVLRGPGGGAPRTAPPHVPPAPPPTVPGHPDIPAGTASGPHGTVTPADPLPDDLTSLSMGDPLADDKVATLLLGDLPPAHPAMGPGTVPEGVKVAAKQQVAAALTARLDHLPDEVLLDPAVARALTTSAWTAETDNHGTVEYTADPNGEIPAGDPRPRAYQRQVVVARLVSRWAGTSNDTDAGALAMQEAAAAEFGLSGHRDWPLSPEMRAQVDAVHAEQGPVLRAFLRAQYDETQARLAAAGITEVTLHRGMRFDHPTDPTSGTPESSSATYDLPPPPDWAADGGTAEVPLRPLSSFSANPGTGALFADQSHGTGVVLSGTVPADRILATPRSGVGSLAEAEFVTLAGPGQWRVRAHTTVSDGQHGYVREPHNPTGGSTPPGAAAAPPVDGPSPAAATGGTPAPEAQPVGAYAYFETPDGGAAAWYDGIDNVGYLRTDATDPSTTVRLDPEPWSAEVDGRGMTEQPPPTAPTPPVPGPAEADHSAVGRTATSTPTPHTQAASPDQTDTYLDAGLDFTGIDAYVDPMDTGLEEGDTYNRGRRHQVAGQAKAEVVADLTRRMGHLPDEQMLSAEDLDRLATFYWLRNGNSVLGWTPSSASADPAMREFADMLVREGPGGLVPPNAPEVRAAMRTEAVNALVRQWALTSNDGDPTSLALQATAADLFGLDSHADWTVSEETQAAVDRLRADHGPLYEAFLLAQYDATQDRLAEHGISHVHLFRGHTVRREALGTGGWVDAIYDGYDERGYTDVAVPLRPMSSFTTDRGVAYEFGAKYGQSDAADAVVLEGSVPASRVIATPRSGAGCLDEAEFIVLHGPGAWRVRRARDFDFTGDDPAEGGDGYTPPTGGPARPMTAQDWRDMPVGSLLTASDLRAAIDAMPDDARTAWPGRMHALVERARAMGAEDLLPDAWTQPPVAEMSLADLRAEVAAGAPGPREQAVLAELTRRQEVADAEAADPATFDPLATANPLTLDDYDAAAAIPVEDITDARTYAAAVMAEYVKAAHGDPARRAALYAARDRFTIVGASALPADWATG